MSRAFTFEQNTNAKEFAMLSIRSILHPTDFSQHSEAAFGLACSLAPDYNARLLVVYVKHPEVVIGEMYTLPPEPAEVWVALREQLSRLRPPDSTIQVEHRLEEGDPAMEILRIAQEDKCDLVVMGTHGRTGVGRLLMGSVAEQVVRKAPCPVLTVKIPLRQALPAEEPVPATVGKTAMDEE
jgi:nucleotide-binding universal stress UspA family protein